MKKTLLSLLIAGALVLTINQNADAGGKKDAPDSILTIGATPTPHGELLELIKDDLAAQGYTLKVVIYNDYVQPNEALIAGDLDANYFQHIPYLESNEAWSKALGNAFGVHVEPLGLYSNRFKSLAELPSGAAVALANDPSNGGRGLLLLQANGLITLKEGAGLTATVQDIALNPKNLQFRELDAAQLPRALGDVDAVVINGNYALDAGLNPVRDSLILEGADSPYVNIVVVKKGNETAPKILALKQALLSQKIKDYINTKWNGSVVATF
jgi:D-methionine transport system substrate-binding protein